MNNIFPHLGYIALGTAAALVLYGALAAWFAGRRNSENLLRSAENAAWLQALCVFLASLALWQALFQDDFRVLFVQEHSSADLPLFYKFTAFWGGMEGSLLFWELLLACFGLIVLRTTRGNLRTLLPDVLFTLNIVHGFLLGLLLTFSNPLALQSVSAAQGRGLNPLLQHPAMALHPPLLYLGYVGFSVPFAFAVASLLQGRVDNQWLNTTRRWSLGAWYALSVGQMLGGQWAYEELGWGGYWGWDPVENAALMPWLTSTALLHSILLQEKRDMMKIWNLVLIFITFALSLLGTFIVRSGVLNSVHAFAESDIGPAFLIFIVGIMLASFALLGHRAHLIRSRHTAEHLLSRESAFLLNNLLLLGIAVTVFLGTAFPLLAEALRGVKLSVQAPFFNTIITPMGAGLLVLMGLAALLAWRRSSALKLLRNARIPLGAALLLGFALRLGQAEWSFVILCSLITFTTCAIGWDFLRTTWARRNQQQESFPRAAWNLLLRNPQRWGGSLVHLGIVALFLGLAGNYLNAEYTHTFRPGEAASFGRYELLYKGLGSTQQENATLRYAELEVQRNGRRLGILRPARSFYPTQPEPLTEVAIRRSWREDLYLVLASENSDGSATLRVLINPLVALLWFALPLISLGTLLAFLHRPPRWPVE